MKALQGRLKRKEPPPSLRSEEGPAAPAKQTKKAAEMSEEEKKAEHLRRRQQQRESQQERTAGPKPQGEPSVSNCGPGVRPPPELLPLTAARVLEYQQEVQKQWDAVVLGKRTKSANADGIVCVTAQAHVEVRHCLATASTACLWRCLPNWCVVL